MIKVYLFFSAFSVLPSKYFTISDHFLEPLFCLMHLSSWISYSGFQGPFLRLGFK
jgi:hypothetical protein